MSSSENWQGLGINARILGGTTWASIFLSKRNFNHEVIVQMKFYFRRHPSKFLSLQIRFRRFKTWPLKRRSTSINRRVETFGSVYLCKFLRRRLEIVDYRCSCSRSWAKSYFQELYHELNTLDRFEQDYKQKLEEAELLNLPGTGQWNTHPPTVLVFRIITWSVLFFSNYRGGARSVARWAQASEEARKESKSQISLVEEYGWGIWCTSQSSWFLSNRRT